MCYEKSVISVELSGTTKPQLYTYLQERLLSVHTDKSGMSSLYFLLARVHTPLLYVVKI